MLDASATLGQSAAGSVAAGDDSKNLLTSKKKKAAKPAYLQSLNESEKQANFKIIDSMNKKISYLKNPRYKVNKAPILMTTVSPPHSPAGQQRLGRGQSRAAQK